MEIVMAEQSKRGFAAKLDNFWYYYKWHTIIGIFVLILAVVLITQLTGRESYDMQVLYAGPHIFKTGEKESIESAFSQLLKRDYNGDGKKNCDLMNITIMTDSQLKEAMESADNVQSMVLYNTYSEDNVRSSLTQEVAAGEHVICLFDPVWYQMVADLDGFVPLSDVLGYVPEGAADPYSIRLCDTDFAQYFDAFSVLPEDTILCMRRIASTIVFTGVKKAEARYEDHRDILKAVFSFRLPDDFETKPKESLTAD